MATSIGKLALQLSANPAGLVSGLNSALKTVDSFAGKVGAFIAKATTPPAVLKKLEGSFKTAFAVPLDEEGIFNTLGKTAKLAGALGMTTEQFTGMAYAAKRALLDEDSFAKGVIFLQRVLSKSTTINEIAADSLDEVGKSAENAGERIRSQTLGGLRGFAFDAGAIEGLTESTKAQLEKKKVRIAAALDAQPLRRQIDELVQGGNVKGFKFGVQLEGLREARLQAEALANAPIAASIDILNQQFEILNPAAQRASEVLSEFKGIVEDVGVVAGGKAGAGLKRFGLNADELGRMPVAEAINKIADRFNQLPPGMERSALAFAAFGKKGVFFAKFLENGSEGLKKIAAEGRTLGVVFNDTEAAAATLARGSLMKISTMFKGVKMRLAIEFAPVIAALTENFGKWIASTGGVVPIIKSIADVVYGIVDSVLGLIQGAAQLIGSVQTAGKNLATVLVSGPTGLLQDAEARGTTKDGQIVPDTSKKSGIADTIGDFRRRLTELREGTSKFTVKPPINETWTKAVEKAEFHLKLFDDALKAFHEEGKRDFRNLSDSVKGGVWEGDTEGIKRQRDALEGLVKFHKEALATLTEVQTAAEGIGKFAPAIESLNKSSGDLGESLRNQIESFGLSDTEAKIASMGRQRLDLVKQLAEATAMARLDDSRFLSGKDREDLKGKVEQARAQIAEFDARQLNLVAMSKQVERMNELKGLQDDAKKLWEDAKSPVEKFGEEMDRLDRMLKLGLIDWQRYAFAVDRAGQSLGATADIKDRMFAGPAVLKGSAEALRITQQARFAEVDTTGNRMQQVLDKIRMLQEQQKNINQAQLADNRKFHEELKKLLGGDKLAKG